MAYFLFVDESGQDHIKNLGTKDLPDEVEYKKAMQRRSTSKPPIVIMVIF